MAMGHSRIMLHCIHISNVLNLYNGYFLYGHSRIMALSKKLTTMDELISCDPLYLAKVSLFICVRHRILVELKS